MDRQCWCEGLVHLLFPCRKFAFVVLHRIDVGRNRFSGGTRFALGAFCHVHAGKAKERWLGLATCWFRVFSSVWLGDLQERQEGEKGGFLMDLCMGIKFCQNPDIFQESQVLNALGLAVALELSTIRAIALWKKQCKKQ